jgi:hypothetical protein
MTINENYCQEHSTKVNEVERKVLEAKIGKIPKYQGSGWYRHKCPFCAYERGFQDGQKAGKKAVAQKLEQLITS